MNDYHEPPEKLGEQTIDFSRALTSLKEEIEAINWYHQRIDATQDEALKELLMHNEKEEIEHACMTLEWLRRNMDGWEEQLSTYLFKQGPITELESSNENDKDERSDLNIRKIDEES